MYLSEAACSHVAQMRWFGEERAASSDFALATTMTIQGV